MCPISSGRKWGLFFKNLVSQQKVYQILQFRRVVMSDKNEKELIDSIESGEWSPVKDFNTIKHQLMAAASETALKDHRINVRVSKRDAEALKTRALEEGISYQTLVTSI
jgi:predicted DNA binding CopG/RHH family protein